MTDTFDKILTYVLYLGLGFGGLFLVLVLLSVVEMPYRKGKRKTSGGGDPVTRGLSEKNGRERTDRCRTARGL